MIVNGYEAFEMIKYEARPEFVLLGKNGASLPLRTSAVTLTTIIYGAKIMIMFHTYLPR